MNGILGTWDLYGGTTQSIVVGDKTAGVIVTLSICNRRNDSTVISVGVTSNANAIASDEYIEYNLEVPAYGVVERTGIALAENQYLTVKSSKDGVNAMAWGIPYGNDSTVTAITQNLGNAPVWATSATLPEIIYNTSNSVSILASDDSLVSYAITSGSLPTGLSYNTTTSILSGTPTTISSYSALGESSTITITATDTLGNATPRTFTIPRYWGDGTTSTRAVPTSTTVSAMIALTSQTSGDIWVKDLSGTSIQTKLYSTGGTAYLLMAGISDDTVHPSYSSGLGNWYGNWTSTTTFGDYTTANQVGGYKNRLWFNYNYDDILVMQGTTNGNISADYYTNSSEVARTTNGFLSLRGRNLRTFLSGANGPGMLADSPDIRSQSGGNRFLQPVSFLKGSAAASEARYRSNSVSELNPSNELDFGRNNVENYRFAVINALGCRSDGGNIEHHSWVADAGNNYSNRNFPEPNWDSTWGINLGSNWLYWLWWCKS